MVCSISVDKSEEKLKINSDSYDLNRISDVQVKELTWKDKLTNMLMFGLITSSILFYFIPTEAQGKGMTLFLPAVAFLVGMVMAMITSVAEKMSGAWLNFARTGNPNAEGLPQWDAYTEEGGATMFFNNRCEVKHHHDKELLEVVRAFPTRGF